MLAGPPGYFGDVLLPGGLINLVGEGRRLREMLLQCRPKVFDFRIYRSWVENDIDVPITAS
jgi:hypothetical protein